MLMLKKNILKVYKFRSSGIKKKISVNKSLLWKKGPEKSLVKRIKNTGGRNNLGRITCQGRHNPRRRLYRIIDFHRKNNIPAIVERIEYDPNRSAHIALLRHEDNSKSYILATKNMQIGDKIKSGNDSDTLEGNCLKLLDIPIGSSIHNLEMNPGKGGKIIRSAGNSGLLLGKELGRAIVVLPSKEVRSFSLECKATIGIVSNAAHFNEKRGSAGESFHRNRRPKVRGIAKNPIDHPNGGKSNGGKVFRNFTGRVMKGKITRNKKKYSNIFILTTRKIAKK